MLELQKHPKTKSETFFFEFENDVVSSTIVYRLLHPRWFRQ
jgi:hypothetical protein